MKTYKNYKIVISWIVVIIWMSIIFCLSAQPANESNQLSLGVTGIILRFIENLAITTGINSEWIFSFNHIVRKSAHAFAYFVLATLVVNAVLNSGIKRFRAFTYAFIFTALYACTDEIHQMFVMGRGSMLSDVGIDCLGAIVGLGIFGLVYIIVRREKNKVV